MILSPLAWSAKHLSWEDYGSHRVTYPPVLNDAGFLPDQLERRLRLHRADQSRTDRYSSPGLGHARLWLGELNVGLRYSRASDSRTSTLFVGRLPIIHGEPCDAASCRLQASPPLTRSALFSEILHHDRSRDHYQSRHRSCRRASMAATRRPVEVSGLDYTLHLDIEKLPEG